jgi:hypothetical protein
LKYKFELKEDDDRKEKWGPSAKTGVIEFTDKESIMYFQEVLRQPPHFKAWLLRLDELAAKAAKVEKTFFVVEILETVDTT